MKRNAKIKRNEEIRELVKIGMSSKKARKTYVYRYVGDLYDLSARQVRSIVEEEYVQK